MAVVYLIPAVLDEEGYTSIPPYITESIAACQVFFVENERTTRRYFKQLWKEMVIDDYAWHVISEEPSMITAFRDAIRTGKTIGIVSEAGCPGVADPGQALVAIAQDMNATVKPLTGPSSILLALMASGMNGQQFAFVGYLPIDNQQRSKAIKDLELVSARNNATQLFIETPYRNQQLFDALRKTCQPGTRLCIAADITGKNEWIKTMTIRQWQQETPALHKRPVVFVLHAEK